MTCNVCNSFEIVTGHKDQAPLRIKCLYDISDIDKAFKKKYPQFKRALGTRRHVEVSHIRHMYRYFLREYASLTLCQIGTIMGMHHSTVIHSLQYVRGQLDLKYFNRVKEDKQDILNILNK